MATLLPFTCGTFNRTLSAGLLKTSSINAEDYLPKLDGEYAAGDVRARENPGLSSLHTIFVREHNRIASTLAAMDSSLSDEELYQRCRRFHCHRIELWFKPINQLPILFQDCIGRDAEYSLWPVLARGHRGGFDGQVSPGN